MFNLEDLDEEFDPIEFAFMTGNCRECGRFNAGNLNHNGYCLSCTESAYDEEY